VLADEPTGNLDEDTAASVMQVMRDLVAETGAGLLMVTHSTALASQLDRRVLLRAGQIA
jgi:putative ABC transport system ATP-binding protein